MLLFSKKTKKQKRNLSVFLIENILFISFPILLILLIREYYSLFYNFFGGFFNFFSNLIGISFIFFVILLVLNYIIILVIGINKSYKKNSFWLAKKIFLIGIIGIIFELIFFFTKSPDIHYFGNVGVVEEFVKFVSILVLIYSFKIDIKNNFTEQIISFTFFYSIISIIFGTIEMGIYGFWGGFFNIFFHLSYFLTGLALYILLVLKFRKLYKNENFFLSFIFIIAILLHFIFDLTVGNFPTIHLYLIIFLLFIDLFGLLMLISFLITYKQNSNK